MLPWNYGFDWNTGHIIFLGAFYAVLAAIAATADRCGSSLARAMRAGQTDCDPLACAIFTTCPHATGCAATC